MKSNSNEWRTLLIKWGIVGVLAVALGVVLLMYLVSPGLLGLDPKPYPESMRGFSTPLTRTYPVH